MSVVWSAQYFTSSSSRTHLQDTRVHTKWAVQHTFMYMIYTFHHLLFPLNPATIHSDLENKGNKNCSSNVFLTEIEVETTKCSNIYDTLEDMIRH